MNLITNYSYISLHIIDVISIESEINIETSRENFYSKKENANKNRIFKFYQNISCYREDIFAR